MKNMPMVMRLARTIRRGAERYHVQVHDIKNHDLSGWCAVTSNILFEELARRGIQSRLTWNGSHCFLTYGRYLIDITATQFNSRLPKVVKRVRTERTRALFYWAENDSERTRAGREKNRDWACGPGRFQQEWQEEMRAHLKTVR